VSIRCGPHKIVVLHCGKFDFAEVEIDVPVHLIGPNNVGKTSLIALLQFLYLDDQRVMQFCRDMADTRRYYFPEKYSYALFECLTPTGFQVMGVHGLGPVRQHEYERFVYTGRIDLSDYLDEQKRMREPEDTVTRLANKSFKRMEPRHLKAALTGVGDARDVFLGLVPAKHGTTYERFRKVFGNILRLSHIRQDELKQLLLDIYSNEFQQREIDLVRHYSAGFEQVRRDSHEVQELKLLQGDIERLLRHLERRDHARTVIPALWQAIGQAFTKQKAEYNRQETHLQDVKRAIEAEQNDVKALLDKTREEERDCARKSVVLEQKLAHVEEQRTRFRDFVSDWARQRLITIKAQQEDLVVKLRNAADEPVEQVRKRLRTTEEQLGAKRLQFENLAHAAVNLLRKDLKDQEIAEAFSVLNPDWLKVPTNTAKPGITTKDASRAADLIKRLLACRKGQSIDIEGVSLDLSAVSVPRLAEYLDPKRIQDDLAALERDVQRYKDTLEAAKHAEPLREEKAALEKEQTIIIRDLGAYDEFCAELEREAEWKAELAGIQKCEQNLLEQITNHERRRSELVEADQQNKAALADLHRKREMLQEQVQKLPQPPESWPVKSVEDMPVELDDLASRYRKSHAEEQSQSESVLELLDTIEKRTYGRYTAPDEAGTIQALRDQLDSIPQRERAVVEMWKGVAVGIKKDLQNIGRDLETLKGLVGGLNRQISSVSISNLASLKLLIEEWPQWVKLIREITVDDELPLFSNPKAAEEALEGIGRLLSEHPRVDLRDLFNLCFEVGTPDGKTHRHEHLDAIESNGTTVAIKVLVNLILLRGLLGGADVQIPFYLDECSSLDQANLKAIVNMARQMGFVAVLASPEAMDAADKLYFMEENKDGRVILDPHTAMLRIERQGAKAEGAVNA